MALVDVADVTQAVATCLDDPGMTSIDQDYVIPFLNLRWDTIQQQLVMLGLQYSEVTAVIPAVPAGTTSLSDYMESGQPLASLMKPISIEWKLSGTPDTEYDDADQESQVDDVDQGSQGLLEYSFQGGTINVTPSAVPMDVRVNFQAMSTKYVDPTDDVVIGTGNVIAFRVAEIIYAIRGNDKLQATMKSYGDDAMETLSGMSVMGLQGIRFRIPATHPRNSPRRFVALASTNTN